MKKMFVKLSPQRRDDQLCLARDGSALVFNGTRVDLVTYDRATAPCDWIVAEPQESDDGWHVEVILPHGPAAPHSTRFPDPIEVVSDGEIDLPPYGPTAQIKLFDADARDASPPAPQHYQMENLSNFLADPSALDAIPDARTHIAEVIAYWAATDLTLRLFLQTRFGPDLEAATGLLEALRSDGSLAQGLKVAASLTGDRRAIEDTASFLQRRNILKKHRDSFAHGAWFISGDHTDKMLLAESKERLGAKSETESIAESVTIFRGLRMSFWAWSARDFRQAALFAIRVRNEATQLIDRFP